MLEHLREDPSAPKTDDGTDVQIPLFRAKPSEIIAAQAETSDFLKAVEARDQRIVAAREVDKAKEDARRAFAAVAAGVDESQTREALLQLHTTGQVDHLRAMLAAYDYEFIGHVASLRNYVVARLLEESLPTAKNKSGDKIKALTQLGKVTELGLFTDKVKVEAAVTPPEEVDQKIKDKLQTLSELAGDITDVVEVPGTGEPPRLRRD